MARKAPVFSSMCCRACGNRGTVWRDKPRLNIPGSIWLPDTGYGKLAAAAEEYLRRGIELASGGNNAALLVIYCQEIAGCPGTRRNAFCLTAIRTWPGTPREPKVGSAPIYRSWIRDRCRERRKAIHPRVNERSGPGRYSICRWIMRPSANNRWSIAVGTSQTNLITRRRSSKIRVSHTS